MKNKRGISPVVATVLLITITIIAIVAIFLWARSTIDAQATKFGTDIKSACDDVDLQVSLSGSDLSIVNLGSVSVDSIDVKDSGDLYRCDGIDLAAAASTTISVGTCIDDLGGSATSADSVIPILVSDQSSLYSCEKNEIDL